MQGCPRLQRGSARTATAIRANTRAQVTPKNSRPPISTTIFRPLLRISLVRNETGITRASSSPGADSTRGRREDDFTGSLQLSLLGVARKTFSVYNPYSNSALLDGTVGLSGITTTTWGRRSVVRGRFAVSHLVIAGGKRLPESSHHHQSFTAAGTSLRGSLDTLIVIELPGHRFWDR